MERLFPERAAPVWFEPCLDSTNRLLKDLAAQGAESGTVVIAGQQTGGRGRLGRSFASPEGGLYLSVLLRPDCPLEQTVGIPPLAGVAVCRALRAVTGLEAKLKWPNDVILNGKKLCGILVESAVDAKGVRLFVGIGVNVNLQREDFPEAIRETACSILTETGDRIKVLALAEELIRQLDGLYEAWRLDSAAFLREYRRACVNLGREVLILREEKSLPAKALDIDDDYSLRVRYPDGSMENIRFGEVSVRGLGGYV